MRRGKNPKGIVWLASYPRSGNTWTRNFLYNLLRLLVGRTDQESDINRLHEFSVWDISAPLFQKVLRKPVTQASRAEIAQARSLVQRNLLRGANGVALVKTHNALVLDHGVPTINLAVTSGAVYIVRNPLDVTISFAHHFGISIDSAIAALNRRGFETDVNAHAAYEVYGSWSQHVMSWTRKAHRAIYIMRYEDMLAKPLDTFTKLAAHLLIPATGEQIVRALDLASFEQAKAQEKETGYAERPAPSPAFFREGRSGQWREVLSEDQVRRIVSAHCEQMERFGYVPDGVDE